MLAGVRVVRDGVGRDVVANAEYVVCLGVGGQRFG